MAERDRDIWAGELALGPLDGDERRAAEALRARDREFAHLVELWERRLAPLGEALEPVAPPDTLWERIGAVLARNGDRPQSTKVAQDGDVAARLAELARRERLWRRMSLASAALTIALAVLVFATIGPPWPFGQGGVRPRSIGSEQTAGGSHISDHRPYVALLMGKDGRPAYLITVTVDPPRMRVRNLGTRPPPKMAHELWLVPKEKGQPALTLGIIGPKREDVLAMPRDRMPDKITPGTQLAVSLEPEGGAPSGRSMGPILFAGELLPAMP